MTSYEFEKAAKNAVIDYLNIPCKIDDLDLVWFAHELGNKKCTIYEPYMGYYAEVTYNKEKDEMYLVIYVKVSNKIIPSDEFNFSATKENN